MNTVAKIQNSKFKSNLIDPANAKNEISLADSKIFDVHDLNNFSLSLLNRLKNKEELPNLTIIKNNPIENDEKDIKYYNEDTENIKQSKIKPYDCDNIDNVNNFVYNKKSFKCYKLKKIESKLSDKSKIVSNKTKSV